MIYRDFFFLGCTGGLSRLCFRDFEANDAEEAKKLALEYEQFKKFENAGGKVFHVELQEIKWNGGGTYKTVKRVQVTPPPFLVGKKEKDSFIEKGAEEFMKETAKLGILRIAE